jgi:cytochrome c oxidase cbb3-type subunit 4
MKFINYLESITGIGIYPLISLIIFFSFFTIVGIFVYKADKNFIKEVSNIPLDDNNA